VVIHLALNFLVLWDFSLWYIPIIITATHFLIDATKLLLQHKKNKRLWFFLDQALHLLVMIAVYLLFVEKEFEFSLSPPILIYLTGAIFLTMPVSLVIKTLISVYKPNTEIEEDDSLENAGTYIGILERLLVFVFIVSNHWEGVGFLIAAKSIFRFSDLTQSKDRKLTEYILIGTLLSFGIAIATAIACNFIINSI
jgi:hypothetical protein